MGSSHAMAEGERRSRAALISSPPPWKRPRWPGSAAPRRSPTSPRSAAASRRSSASTSGRPVAYFDGPGGTQVAVGVVKAMADYLFKHNANTHWRYPSSVETDAALGRGAPDVRRLLQRRSVGGRVRPEHDDADVPPVPRARPGVGPGRRDRRHGARPSRQRGHLEGSRARPGRDDPHRPDAPGDRAARRGRSRERHPAGGQARGDRRRVERPRNDQRRPAHLRARPGGGRALLRRRRALRPACADRRRADRLRLPGVLAVQVLRPAPRRAVGTARAASTLSTSRGSSPRPTGRPSASRRGPSRTRGSSGAAAAVDFLASLAGDAGALAARGARGGLRRAPPARPEAPREALDGALEDRRGHAFTARRRRRRARRRSRSWSPDAPRTRWPRPWVGAGCTSRAGTSTP